MKYLLTILLIVTFTGAALAQTAQGGNTVEGKVAARAGVDAKLYTELLASSEKLVKGAPFSADVVNESVQTLADGNRIVRTSNSKMFRDSEGRFRRDGTSYSGGNTVLGFYSNVMNTTITDPVNGMKYFLDDKNKTFRKWVIKPPIVFKGEEYEVLRSKLKETYAADAKMTPQAMVELEKTLAVQGKGMTIVTTPSAQSPAAQADLERALNGKIAVAGTPMPAGDMFAYSISGSGGGNGSGYLFNTESLGTRSVEGVEAEGTRTTTTIPAGAIGNERPIDIVYEKWYSKDLQLIVYSKHSDPRYGDQVYKLTGISRSEPDPSVFTVPSDYKAKAEGYAPAAGSAYRITQTAPRAPAVAGVPGVPGVAATAGTPGVAATPAAVPATVTSTVKAVAAPKKAQ